MNRVLIIGDGYAGTRFRRAFDFLDESRRLRYSALAVADPKRAAIDDGIRRFASVEEALDRFQPDIICNTTNEIAHVEVFKRLEDYPRSLVLTEKPLAHDEISSSRSADYLSRHLVSMNLVERFSPIVERVRAWIRQLSADVTVIKVEANWGKNRVFDPRPTSGVMSEAVHAVDLVDILFANLTETRWDGFLTEADYASSGAWLPESFSAAGFSRDSRITLSSSFAWPQRIRSIHAMLRSEDRVYSVLMNFDDPKWDCDDLLIREISTTGRYRDELMISTSVENIHPSIRGVSKVVAFIEASCAAWRGDDVNSTLIADTDRALALQRILSSIERDLHRSATRLPLHGATKETDSFFEPSRAQ
ncbi:hypothetical protein [Streptomyces sp. BE230]|uniref:hypothetical protein n=1 Tax=Streptomyces sp. BE230 TaxID=3002526 RepID=UPI002ED0B053|nr:hypothetical protein [Streptomyces sp. BE230]